MKQLTKQEQEQAVELITDLVESTEKSAIYNRAEYIESAKAFLQSLKPKIYVCQNNCGFFYFFTKSVLNEEFALDESYAHRFDSIEQAQIFIDEYKEKDYPMYVVIG